MTVLPKHFPYPLITLAETDSTNRYLNQLCNENFNSITELTTVCADYQTAGKGQRGNSWEAAKGQNLLFSFVLYPNFMEAQQQFILSQIISLAIKEALEKFVDNTSIKWPNDIYWQEKKICGILIENELQGRFINRCIAGIGLNVNQESFQSNAPNPISLKQITGQNYNRHELLTDIVTRIYSYYTQLRTEDSETFHQYISARYAKALFRREGFHLYADVQGIFPARIIEVKADGRFVLEDKQGKIRSYLFKEVQYVL